MPSYKKQAFTLIELLIVIVILGILAGTVLAVINPQQLINKSKDEKIKEMMRKMSLVLSAEYIASGADISFTDFIASISPNGSRCNPTPGNNSFSIVNVPTNWVGGIYCPAPGGFYLYTTSYAPEPYCIATVGFTGRTYAINRLGVLKSGGTMQTMCADFDSAAWTVE